MIIDNRRYEAMPEIHELFEELKQKQENRKVATITTTKPLSQEQQSKLIEKLKHNLKLKTKIKDLEKILEKGIEHHKNLLVKGYIDKKGLNKKENRNKIISAIEGIVDKYHLNKKLKKDLEIKSGEELAATYIGLASQTYRQENG